MNSGRQPELSLRPSPENPKHLDWPWAEYASLGSARGRDALAARNVRLRPRLRGIVREHLAAARPPQVPGPMGPVRPSEWHPPRVKALLLEARLEARRPFAANCAAAPHSDVIIIM